MNQTVGSSPPQLALETFGSVHCIYPMRAPFLTLGILAFLIGTLWIGQGTGLVNWPKSSFMISQMQWAYYGAALAALGVGLMGLALVRR
ncbi:hypothetical protein AB8A31_05430 [Tardiphaga sp. 804_B3_N1_9]|jgi:hypothetical protein|uniref:hypothetical protein n=2 Tax=Nitrobacteraceae TaxID=41294 RepID=UPI003B8A8D6D